MQGISYRVTFVEGERMLVDVNAASINAGFRKALTAILMSPVPGVADQEISSVEFWMVRDRPLVDTDGLRSPAVVVVRDYATSGEGRS